jgi:hypothetical protein
MVSTHRCPEAGAAFATANANVGAAMIPKPRTRVARTAGALLGALACLSGCKLDDRTLLVIDGSPESNLIVLDTFDDGSLRPDDPRFDDWQFITKNPDTNLPPGAFATARIVTPGYHGGSALELDWEVVDVADGQPNYPGVTLFTRAVEPIDLSGLSGIVFADKYAHAGSCQAVPLLTVVVDCALYQTSFETFAGMPPDWTTTTIAFANLQEAAATGVERDLCLKKVDAIAFHAQVNLADGDCASGTLSLDDVALEP